MTKGVLYFNYGHGCLVRLLVSLYSLRKHYQGPITILSDGDGGPRGQAICRAIGRAMGADVVVWDCGIADGPNKILLAKTRYHTASQYDLTIVLDSDTLIQKPIDRLFEVIEEYTFLVSQFSDWTTFHLIMESRIKSWSNLHPKLVERALMFGPAVNCGVLGFRKSASILKVWEGVAVSGRDLKIPDEVACQMLLIDHQHFIVDESWNRSSVYSHLPIKDAKIIHYHGSKHCYGSSGKLWIEIYDRVLKINIAGINKWTPANDRKLTEFLDNRALSLTKK